MYKYKPRHDYRAKCLGIVTLRVLPTTCFPYNSEEISSKFPIPKMKPITTTEISTRKATQTKYKLKQFKGKLNTTKQLLERY